MGWEKLKCEFVEVVFNNLVIFLFVLFLVFFYKINFNFFIKIYVDKCIFYKNVFVLLIFYCY